MPSPRPGSVGAEPSGVVEDQAGKLIFVANRIYQRRGRAQCADWSRGEAPTGRTGASYLTLSPDGKRIYVTHIYPNPPAQRTGLDNRTPPESEITVIDAARALVLDRIPLRSIAGVFHLAISADGRLGAVAEYHPKNMVPLAHLEHGGAFAYTLTLFGTDVGQPVEIPLDELDRYASQPFGVVISPDMSRMYVSVGGSECVLAIDIPRLLHFIHARPRPASGSYASDLSASANYVIARIPVGHNPRGLALSRDGLRLLVANRLGRHHQRDRHARAACRLDHYARRTKGGERAPPRRADVLYGALLLSGADRLLQLPYRFHLRWTAVGSGAGRLRNDIVDNKMLEDIKDIAPYKWNGGNPNLPTECGPRTEKYFWRSENFDVLTLTDLVTYIRSLAPRPNRWRLPRP